MNALGELCLVFRTGTSELPAGMVTGRPTPFDTLTPAGATAAFQANPSPGQPIVTGSARAALGTPTLPGTGRPVQLPTWSMDPR